MQFIVYFLYWLWVKGLNVMISYITHGKSTGSSHGLFWRSNYLCPKPTLFRLYTWRICFAKTHVEQVLLILPEHLDSPPVFLMFLLLGHHIFVQCAVDRCNTKYDNAITKYGSVSWWHLLLKKCITKNGSTRLSTKLSVSRQIVKQHRFLHTTLVQGRYSYNTFINTLKIHISLYKIIFLYCIIIRMHNFNIEYR